MFLQKTFRTGLVFPSWSKWVQIVVCYDRKLQKDKCLSGISTFLHKTFRTGFVFLSQLKWVQIVVCYDWNLQKHKYLSGISTFLHETFRTGLIFPSRSKWVQIVVCYMWKLQKCKYLSELPFWADQTHFFWKIWHCGSFLASLVQKELEKSKNSKNYGKLWGKTYKMTKIDHFEQI